MKTFTIEEYFQNMGLVLPLKSFAEMRSGISKSGPVGWIRRFLLWNTFVLAGVYLWIGSLTLTSWILGWKDL
jgi:hypothetical protein